MELEFDKEIDSLLRKADRGPFGGDRPGDGLGVHLDADQLSAFAENAVPEKSRALYMSHLADCDHCRRILSGLIALNAEAEPAEERVVAPAIVPAIAAEPWYKRLLLPNLAYVMGGLVLIFGGLISFSLLQSSMSGENATISQSVANATNARGPMDVAEELQTSDMSSNSNTASANKSVPNANAMANATAASNTAPSGSTIGELQDRDSAPRDDRSGIALDGIDGAKPAAAAPPPPPPAAKTEANETVAAAAERSREVRPKEAEKKKDLEDRNADVALSAKQRQDVPRSQAGGVAKATPGPSRDGAQNFPNRANNTFDMYEEKRVSGKTFQRRDNVWYDRAYRSQATINVRRNTDEYRKLDSGLRVIAESLSGTVVVMWEKKAYRIQ